MSQRQVFTSGHESPASARELILRKRDGRELSDKELRFLIQGFLLGEVTDYQMAAWAMAVFFQGMTERETRALTQCMLETGSVVDLRHVKGPKIDKHSTGGVGDKVSICLAPIMAACGLRVPMMSGRGLGHTGGTLDKLEAIPGFSTRLSVPEIRRQIADIGCALVGPTNELAPADKRLYALRDVTGTVESIPLITASILSKKLAEGIDGLVLDVKVGRGAFMKTLEQARELARSLVRVGTLSGKKVTAVLTAMDAPLGYAVGNALETREAFAVLGGGGPGDVVECTLALGAEMLRLAGKAKSDSEARQKIKRAIQGGAAIQCMERIVSAQGGNPRVVREPDRLPKARHEIPIPAPKSGYVTAIEACEIGLAAVALGAGRMRATDSVDPAVGILLHRKPGERVRAGELLATAHVQELKASATQIVRINQAFAIGPKAPSELPLVLEVLRSRGAQSRKS